MDDQKIYKYVSIGILISFIISVIGWIANAIGFYKCEIIISIIDIFILSSVFIGLIIHNNK